MAKPYFFSPVYCLLSTVYFLLLTGCVLTPKGTDQEQTRLTQAGKPFETPFEKRPLPDLPKNPDWPDLLHRAFLANGDLESAYFEWKAARARIDQAAAYPNTNISVGFEYMFSREKQKAWDNTTLSAGFNQNNLTLPTKVAKAGQVALQAARAAGDRFQSAKFDLQQRVLTSYLDLALAEEKIRIQRDNVSLLKLLVETAANRLQSGSPQQDLLKAQIEWRLAENELANMESEARATRATLNALLARAPDAPLNLPPHLPDPRPILADDAKLIAVAVDRNPELSALAHQVAGRADALQLAKMAYLPDLSPTAAINGNISQTLGAMVMLPTALPLIRGSINEAQAMLQSTQAIARQTRSDRAASFVATLYALRNTERQITLFNHRILPAARQVMESSRQAYSAGTIPFSDLIDTQRTLLDVRLMIAQASITREKYLSTLETLAATDIETLAQPTTQPTTQKGTHP